MWILHTCRGVNVRYEDAYMCTYPILGIRSKEQIRSLTEVGGVARADVQLEDVIIMLVAHVLSGLKFHLNFQKKISY